MQTRDKFVAFVDIIGWSAMVTAAEADGGDLSHLAKLLATLGSPADADRFKTSGPTTCPGSARIANDLDFQITQISDCVVVSAEVSPAGIVNLAHHCFGISVGMLQQHALCRGFITRGPIHHEPNQVIGSAYQVAYGSERHVAFRRGEATETGTPFIQVDDAVVDYVRTQTDNCVRMMFGRATLSDGSFTAIYPFKALGKVPSTVVGRDFSPTTFIESVRRSISYREADLRVFDRAEGDAPNEKEKMKVRHYKRGIEEVIAALRAKETLVQTMIDTGRIPYGSVIA